MSDIEVAVTEACTNVLRHVEGTEHEYEVTVAVNEDQCDIRLVDTAGRDFDHDRQGRAEAHPESESGRGIFLMRAMVDELNFVSPPDDGSVVHLVKRLDLQENSILRRLAGSPAG